MPLQPLQTYLDRTGSQFSQKLQSLQGMAQSVKSAQTRKQQMIADVQQKKEMVQFRSDVQLEQKKQYYEDVTKPKQEAERQREILKQYTENLRQSREDAQKQMTEFEKYKNKSRFSSIKEYGLDQFKFQPEVVEQDGKIAGYDVKVQYGDEEIPKNEYFDMVSRINNFTDKLKSVEGADANLTTYQQDGVLYLGNDDQGQQILNKIRTDEDAKFQYFGMDAEQRIKVSNKTPEGETTDEGGGSVPQGVLNELAPAFDSLRSKLGDQKEQEYQFAEAGIEDDWSVGPIFEDVETPKRSVDFSSSIGDVRRQLNDVGKRVVPEYEDFNISSLSEPEKQMIVSGQVSDEQLQKVPQKRAEAVRKMAGYGEQTREKLGEIFRFHNLYDTIHKEYIKTGKISDPDKYALNVWEAPSDISSMDNFEKLLTPIDEVDSIFKMQQMGRQWSQPTNRFTE